MNTGSIGGLYAGKAGLLPGGIAGPLAGLAGWGVAGRTEQRFAVSNQQRDFTLLALRQTRDLRGAYAQNIRTERHKAQQHPHQTRAWYEGTTTTKGFDADADTNTHREEFAPVA